MTRIRTLLFDATADDASIETAAQLLARQCPGAGTAFWLAHTEEERRDKLLRQTSTGNSDWAEEAADRLGRLAQIDLPFLHGRESPYLRWRLRQVDEDGEESMVEAVGYLFDEEGMRAAISDIEALFAWSHRNIRALLDPDFLGYYADEDGLRDAIGNPVAAEDVKRDGRVRAGEDGDGPWYLYSWLHSVATVFRTAIAARLQGLHVMEVWDFDL